jgi:hypothetical protein
VGCSGNEEEDDFGCGTYCEDIVACGPSWAEQIRGEQDCSWKFGEEEAYDRCLTSCRLAGQGFESTSDEELKECLDCAAQETDASCPGWTEVGERCPCVFDTQSYHFEAYPDIEPLTCDSGDLYPTLADPSEGDALRQRCLDGEIDFCD